MLGKELLFLNFFDCNLFCAFPNIGLHRYINDFIDLLPAARAPRRACLQPSKTTTLQLVAKFQKWYLLVLSFAPGGFSLSSKTNTSNSNSIWKGRTRLNEFLRTLKCFVGKRITIFFFTSANPKPRMRSVMPDKRGLTLSELGLFSFDSQRWPNIIKALRMRMAWTVLIFDSISIFAVCFSRVLFLECFLVR